ncbi:inner membrane protein YnfA, drug/metabolite transporter superfamily [Alicyclobacillus macrosporangiidus]|uniref:Inner membrane protein YnfA, drug/metabolite transporter superfamily n=1 Tax=Alicyclobacillus macrosporangiidus TaxID=392015 RepID=A0A1I7LFD0_9BACL|nr:inner membrane protein YnfA, drug/metabolite transporter superfamily [Alicyclobacillus macrosporangiidus]
MLKAYMLFVIAGLAEIGGGYLVWLWLLNGKPTWVGVVGGFILFLYGVVATRQEFSSFGKVYAAYGGVFIVMSVLWGWVVAKWGRDLPHRCNSHAARVEIGQTVTSTSSLNGTIKRVHEPGRNSA